MAVRKLRAAWWVDFRSERRRYRIRSPENSRAAALAFEHVLRVRLARGESLLPLLETKVTPTFAEFAQDWFETYVKANNKESEQYSKQIYLRVHLVPFFGHLSLADISSHHVERYKALKRSAGLKDTTINHHLTTFVKCLRCALEWGRISALPKVTKIRTAPPPFDFLTPQESEHLLSYAREREPAWRDMILLALRTGMRRGEILGLQWEDVDIDRGKITVRKSLVRGILSCPKNYRFRYLPMTQELRDMLLRRRKRSGFVFQAETGGASAKSTIDRNLTRICRQAGMRHVHWHVFRHTFASQLVGAGMPITVVKELMGHSDIKMTMRYAHFAPSLYDSAVGVLDTLGKPEAKTLGQPVGNGVGIAPPLGSNLDAEIHLNGQQKSPTV